MEIVDRILENTIPVTESGCWLWLGHANNKEGYGRVRLEKKRVLVHRISYQAHIGPIPDGMCVCHKCDVPACVNPAHLFLDTVAGNNKDRAKKGRSADTSGENHPCRKLTEKQVLAVIELKGKISKQEVASRFCVSKWAIADIWSGRTWAHLSKNAITHAKPGDWRESRMEVAR